MRIVYLHQYFNTPKDRGGTRSYEMAKRLVQSGHEVHMVTTNRSERVVSWRWSHQVIEGINVYRMSIPYSNKFGTIARMRAFLTFALAAGWFASRLPADLVLATSTPLTIAIPALIVRNRKKIPMVFEVRDLWPEMPIAIGALRNPVLIAAARWLERLAYQKSVEVIALSPGMAEGVESAGVSKKKVTVIPNAADSEFLTAPDSIGEAFRAAHDWLGNRPLVLYAGTFGTLNGVGYLARLAQDMGKIDADIRFLAVGEGGDKDSTIALGESLGVLNKNFFVMNGVAKKDVTALFSAATLTTSLFIDLPSMWKNSANKFFDGLASGTPVVVNHGGWMADLLRQWDAGLVLDPQDTKKSAELVREKIRDRVWLPRAGTAARNLANTHFNRDKLAKRFEEVLVRASAGRENGIPGIRVKSQS